jgi:hypothetical protein
MTVWHRTTKSLRYRHGAARKKINAGDRREKMRAALTKKCKTLGELDQYIDPRVPVVEAVDMVLTCLKTAGFGPEPGSSELHRARRGVLTLWSTARRVNRMAFWEALTIPRAPKSWTTGAVREQRSELLATAREHLQGGGATRGDIMAAMDALHEVVANMNTIFATGRVVGMDEPEESWALDRYTCAALLPALAEQLNSFWIQLRTATDHQGVHV